MEITINQKRMQGENSDRISNLPDSLVTRILSLLDAREVAQTCILSKRWRNVWSFVPSLLFDLTKFRGEEIRINNFVSSFLHLRNTACTIHTFKLHYQVPWTFDTEKSASIVRTWILYALEHKVRNLQIKFQATPSSCMRSIPGCVFTCDSLEELQLELCNFILTDIVCLPKLRKLVLKNLVISKGAMKSLLSGCPSLETLGFWCCEIKMRSISLQTVKSLSIVDFGFIHNSLPNSISAPCLEYLMLLNGSKDLRVTLKDKYKLMRVKIPQLSNLDILGQIYDVQVLELSMSNLIYFQRELRKCAIYYNLKDLVLESLCVYCHFPMWSSFLKYCPNLTSLCFVHNGFSCQGAHGHHKEKPYEIIWQVEQFPCKHLKTIELIATHYFELKLLKQFLLGWANQIEGLQIIPSKRRITYCGPLF